MSYYLFDDNKNKIDVDVLSTNSNSNSLSSFFYTQRIDILSGESSFTVSSNSYTNKSYNFSSGNLYIYGFVPVIANVAITESGKQVVNCYISYSNSSYYLNMQFCNPTSSSVTYSSCTVTILYIRQSALLELDY